MEIYSRKGFTFKSGVLGGNARELVEARIAFLEVVESTPEMVGMIATICGVNAVKLRVETEACLSSGTCHHDPYANQRVRRLHWQPPETSSTTRPAAQT